MKINDGLTVIHKEYGRKDTGNPPEDKSDARKEFKAILDALTARDNEIKAFAEKASAEIKDHGTILSDTKAALETLAKDGSALQARLMEVEQKLARRGNVESAPDVKGLGQQLTEHESFINLKKLGRGIARMPVKAVTTLSSLTTGTGGVGDAIVPMRLPGIIKPQDRPMTIRDLLMPGTTAGNTIEYVKETGFQNMAAVVSEGASKPQSDLSFDLVSSPVRVIAHWIRASRQVLDDIPQLQSYVDGRLRYGLMYAEETEILAGDGTGQHLLGIIPQATTFDTARTQGSDTKIDTIRRAITQVRIAEYRASGIVLNPEDWEDIELMKDNENRYIWSSPVVNNGQNLWGMPVIDTNAMAAGEFMVGAFNIAAQVFDREDANVQVSTEDADNFTKNMVTIRAEERLGLAVFRSQSFVHGDFPQAS